MSLKFYKKIDHYFKNIKDDIQKKIDTTKDYEYNFIVDNGINIVEIIFDGKVKMKAEYNVIGLYNIGLSVWYWGWALDFVNKKLVEKLDSIKKFPVILEKDYKDFTPYELEELHFITSNNNFYCSSQNLDRIIRFSLFMTQSIWYAPVKYTDKGSNQMDRIEYIGISKILQLN